MQDTQENVNHQVNVILLKKIIELLGTKEEPLESVAIDNLDVVEASLQNNLSKQTKSIQSDLDKQTKALSEVLNGINSTSEKQSDAVNGILSEIKNSVKDELTSVYVKKPRERVEVLNFDEIPTEQTIKNLSDLEPYFKDLAKSLSINVESPTVNVPAPIVNIPQSQVNIPEISFDPLINSLERSLKLIRTNSKSNPLAVRLTDGGEWIKELVKIQKETSKAVAAFAGGSDQVRLVDSNRTIINPAQQESDTLKAFANVAAGTTDGDIVTAVAGKKIRVVSAACVAGATATTLTFNTKPAGAGSAISALFANGANGGEVLGYNPKGWFDTTVSEGLTVTTGAGATTGVHVTYVLV